MQHVTGDYTIFANSSATNEPPVDSFEAKKSITDIPSWLKDERYADLEMQQVAQEFILNRIDIYSSKALLLQYSAKAGKSKGEINYSNILDVIFVVLMKESPKLFKSFDSSR